MANINLFVEISISPESNYIHIDNYIIESYIEEHYKESIESSKRFGIAEKFEVLEGYKNKFIYLENVKFDGRKNKITDDDIRKTLEKEELATYTGARSIFGGFYKPTEKLIDKLNKQLEVRKQLINDGNFVNLKEIA